jgi:2-(1,2-epoxy-1,2-dihydrophenyl)acetyl-CoA isomerase
VTTEPSVLVDIADGIATLTLNRPDASNAFDLTMMGEVEAALERLREDDVRVVVVRGAGARFCAGGDVSSFLASDDPASSLHELAVLAESGLRRLGELPKPVVVGIHGAVAGAGLSFVLNADIVVAARSTRIVAAYPGVGLTPDAGVSWLLPRAVGAQRALRHLLLNVPLTADEALAWGLVAEVVDDDAVVARTDEIAARLASMSPTSLASAKRLVRTGLTSSREDNAADEARTIASALTTPEAQAAIARFLSR